MRPAQLHRPSCFAACHTPCNAAMPPAAAASCCLLPPCPREKALATRAARDCPRRLPRPPTTARGATGARQRARPLRRNRLSFLLPSDQLSLAIVRVSIVGVHPATSAGRLFPERAVKGAARLTAAKPAGPPCDFSSCCCHGAASHLPVGHDAPAPITRPGRDIKTIFWHMPALRRPPASLCARASRTAKGRGHPQGGRGGT
jgi:hypothetical protein